jgi:hypothetical protein
VHSRYANDWAKQSEVMGGDYDVIISSTQRFANGKWHDCSALDLKGHLCIWRDNLFMVYKSRLDCGCKMNSLVRDKCENPEHKDARIEAVMRKLRSMLDYPDKVCARDKNHDALLFTLGYSMDFIKVYGVLSCLSKHPAAVSAANALRIPTNTAMLEYICNPMDGCVN